MKAVVQERYGSPDGLRLREVARPVVKDDSVLVKVRAASVNAADWHMMHMFPGLLGGVVAGGRPSQLRGGDLAGHVEAVGRNVTRFKAGDEVFGVGRGAFAEYAASVEDRLALKPRNLTFEAAAAIPIAGCTALQGLRDHAHVEPGQSVLIYGAGGGVGTFAVQIAKAFGAQVTAVTTTANLDLVRSIGADDAIDYTTDDFTRSESRYDVVVDLGANRTEEDCRRVLAPHGKLLLIGAPSGNWAKLWALLGMLLARKSDRLAYVARVDHRALVDLQQLAEDGRLSPVIGRRYPLSEIAEAFRHLGSQNARGKIVITVA